MTIKLTATFRSVWGGSDRSCSPPGVFTLTAISWYAARVIQDFYNPLYPGMRSVRRWVGVGVGVWATLLLLTTFVLQVRAGNWSVPGLGGGGTGHSRGVHAVLLHLWGDRYTVNTRPHQASFAPQA